MHTHHLPLNDPSDEPLAVNHGGAQSLRALIPDSRLTPALRSALQGLGACIVPFRWPGIDHPDLAGITVPLPGTGPEWLGEAESESLIAALKDMERCGRAPVWAQVMLAQHRAGTLLDSDGTLELADGLSAQGLIAAVLRLPGHQDGA